ncbi:MAG: pantoate--beta-alanine ligase [Gammaproteobacteria bacterium]|nr:MAG: pantoate--beta-alanine ligase [Gammaproteobacteria bacterium]
MQSVTSLSALQKTVSQWKQQGLSVGLVATMGNLHEGHASLVTRAQLLCDKVVVSIFVNPTQFGEAEDYQGYPRTIEADCELLDKLSTDLVFMPDEVEVYPQGHSAGVRLTLPDELENILCGHDRPGHFAGVARVVARLFSMVKPDVAIFGEKDYQQLLLIRYLTKSLDLPIEIVGAPVIRETDGLAMSSRNGYLDAGQRARAGAIYRVLCQMRDALQAGDNDFPVLEQQARQQLIEAGLEPDYVSIRRAEDLQAPSRDHQSLQLLAAASLGKARLIDNLHVDLAFLDR